MASFERDPLSVSYGGNEPDRGFDDHSAPAGPAVMVKEIKADFPDFFPHQRHASVTNGDICTEINVSVYTDHYFVSISQNGRFGTIIKAWQTQGNEFTNATFESNVLLGKREDTVAMLYARQICEKLSLHSTKPLVLCISLVERGRGLDVVRDVLAKLFEAES